jgi:hypothetical protein
MKKLYCVVVVAAVAVSGCVVSSRGHIRVRAPTIVISAPPPPPPRPVVVARPGFVWIEGRQVYRGGRYVWVEGRYEADRAGHHWVQGRWERNGEGHVWVEGHWETRR